MVDWDSRHAGADHGGGFHPGAAGLEIGVETSLSLRRILDDYRERSELSLCALLEEGGQVLSWSAVPGTWQVDQMGALAAGVFASLRALSSRVGETDFKGCFQHGSQRHFQLYPVEETFLLLSVFEKETAPGLVRLYAEETARRLRGLLGEIRAIPDRPGGNLFRPPDFSGEHGETLPS